MQPTRSATRRRAYLLKIRKPGTASCFTQEVLVPRLARNYGHEHPIEVSAGMRLVGGGDRLCLARQIRRRVG
jgi:hypothetical protein